ncbi:MAG: oligosaccharide flippase family protein [Candidatus Giovannonibacteria bacterium]|nr:MAG: oligosaccharide flippase family protein [Candidatus Giovannonibacteria bacterium]
MRFVKLFHADLGNVHHAAFWLGFFGILADALGLLRDRALAGTFGASRELDIYYAAFRVPDFLYTFMLLFTASTAIIPIFLKKFGEEKKGAEELLGSIFAFFSFFVVILSAAAFFLMPWITDRSLPGFSEGEIGRTVLLSRILLLSPFFLGLSNILSSATQAVRRFFAYGLAPVFYNVGILLGILVFYDFFGISGLAWGVAFGAFLHLGAQAPSLRGLGISLRFGKIWSEDIKKIARLSLPRTLGLQITQITTFILTGIASTFSQGSIAVFNLALNLEFIPVTIIGLSYSVAAFPDLVASSLKKSKEEFEKHFSAAMRHIIFWTLPMAVLILVLRAQIVRVVLGSGAFSWTDTRLTAAALSILSLAIVFQSVFMLLTRAFYAEGESWRPLIINAVSSVLSVGAVFWFSAALGEGGFLKDVFGSLLRIEDISDIRAVSLPLGILAGSVFNFIFLAFVFKNVFVGFSWRGIGRAFLQVLSASAVGGLAAYLGLDIFSRVFDLHTFFGVFGQGFLAGVLGILATAASLWALGSKELKEFSGSLLDIFLEREKSKADMVPAPEPERLL